VRAVIERFPRGALARPLDATQGVWESQTTSSLRAVHGDLATRQPRLPGIARAYAGAGPCSPFDGPQPRQADPWNVQCRGSRRDRPPPAVG